MRLLHKCFPVNFAKFLRKHFFTKHLQWLLLNFQKRYFSINLLTSWLLKQATTINDHKPPANDHKRSQTTNKPPLTTSKQPQTTIPAHQTKNLTFRFFFPHPLITRNTPIFKNIQWQISEGRGANRIVGLGPTKVSSINERGVLIKRGPNKNILI